MTPARRIPVLLLVRQLGIGGIERDVAKMARWLDPNQFEVHVGCFSSGGLRELELRTAGLPIVEFPVRSFASWTIIRHSVALRDYLQHHGIRIVHCFDMPTVIFGVPTARLAGTPVVVASNLGHRELFSWPYRWLLRITDRMAHEIVVNSRAMAQHLSDDEKVPHEKISVCYNGVELDVFRPDSSAPRPPIPKPSLAIGAVCALRPEKRLDLLLNAFARIRDSRSGLKLVVAGSGPMLQSLRNLAEHLKISADCHFEPATADVAPWMRFLDIFVLCSDSESFPNALLEAMACGCAVVASAVGGVPELVHDRVNGLLFRRGDVESLSRSLTELIENQDLRKQLAREALCTARSNFPMALAAERTGVLYRQWLDARTPAAPLDSSSAAVNVK